MKFKALLLAFVLLVGACAPLPDEPVSPEEGISIPDGFTKDSLCTPTLEYSRELHPVPYETVSEGPVYLGVQNHDGYSIVHYEEVLSDGSTLGGSVYRHDAKIYRYSPEDLDQTPTVEIHNLDYCMENMFPDSDECWALCQPGEGSIYDTRWYEFTIPEGSDVAFPYTEPK